MAEEEQAGSAGKKQLGQAKLIRLAAAVAIIALLFFGFHCLLNILGEGIAPLGSYLMMIPFVVAMAIAVCIVLGILYLGELRGGVDYAARAAAVARSLARQSTIVRFIGIVLFTAIWAGLIYLFWRQFPMFKSFSSGELTSLLTGGFAPMATFVLVLGAAIIFVNLLYLALPLALKWIASALETATTIGFIVLVAGLLSAFPFSSLLSPEVHSVLYAALVLLLIACILGTIFNLWYLLKVVMYGDAAPAAAPASGKA